MAKTLNKYFVFSDVHGDYQALIKSLEAVNYDENNPNHILISVGDLFDRGKGSAQVYDFIRSHRAIAIRGNHEGFLEDFIDKGITDGLVQFNVVRNGLWNTLLSFSGRSETDDIDRLEVYEEIRHSLRRRHVDTFIKNMPLYYETEHFIFCHAGIDPTLPNWKDTDKDFMLWDIKDTWKPCENTDKVVIIGHHHANEVRDNAERHGFITKNIQDGNRIKVKGVGIEFKVTGNTDEFRPVRIENKIAIDGCTAYTHKLNVLVFEDYTLDDGKKEPAEEPEESKGFNQDMFSNINYGFSNMFANMDMGTVTVDNVNGPWIV